VIKILVGMAAVAVMMTAGFMGWRAYQANVRAAEFAQCDLIAKAADRVKTHPESFSDDVRAYVAKAAPRCWEDYGNRWDLN
jgi:hypothetical protein